MQLPVQRTDGSWSEPSVNSLCYKHFAEAVLSFPEKLQLNADSFVSFGLGIYLKDLCNSQKPKDYCPDTKQMDSARLHPFGGREIMLLQQQPSLPTQTGSKEQLRDV